MRRIRRGRRGEEGAPVELRFIDMFMAAIGALIFMAMMLSFLMRNMGAKETAARIGTPELQVLAYIAPANDPYLLSDSAENNVEKILGRFFIEAQMTPTQIDKFRPNRFFYTNDTNQEGNFVFAGNSLAYASKETPFALLTSSYPAHSTNTFQFTILPCSNGVTGDVNEKKLNEVTNIYQLYVMARYSVSGQVTRLITNGLPVRPGFWATNYPVKPNLIVQVALTEAGELVLKKENP